MDGKVGLVTGAGSPYGIGRSIVIALAGAGTKVIYVCDLNQSNIESLSGEVKKSASSCMIKGKIMDVSSEDQTVRVLQEIIKESGRFDFYFANAGIANYRNLNDMEFAHYKRSIDVMQHSVFLAIKYGSQAMMVTSDEKPHSGGSIVVTSSCAAYMGSYADLSYTTAKAAVNGLVMGGSVQLSSSNVRVNGVAPGVTASSIFISSAQAEMGKEYKINNSQEDIKKKYHEMASAAGSPGQNKYYYNRVASPDEIANIGVFLASDLSSAINGEVIMADGGKTFGATGDAYTGPVPRVKPLKLL